MTELVSQALGREAYFSPTYFARERERIFLDGWICVGHVDRLSEAPSYFTVDLVGEPLAIVRDAKGTVRAFANVCRHRGAILLTANEGRLGPRIVCPYHAWCYDHDGALAAAPHTSSLASFDARRHTLKTFACEVYAGLIFVHVGSQPSPLLDHLGQLRELIDRFPIAALKCTRRIEYNLQCNWKIVVHNVNECAHCGHVHPELSRLSPPESKVDLEVTHGDFIGSYQELHESLSGNTSLRPIPGLAPSDVSRVYFCSLYPAVLLSFLADFFSLLFIWPEGPERTRLVQEWYFHPDQIGQPGFSDKEPIELWDLVSRQDWRVCELVQRGMASRHHVPGPYIEGESLLTQFDRFILDRVGNGNERGANP